MIQRNAHEQIKSQISLNTCATISVLPSNKGTMYYIKIMPGPFNAIYDNAKYVKMKERKKENVLFTVFHFI